MIRKDRTMNKNHIGELVVVAHWSDFQIEDATKLGVLRAIEGEHSDIFYVDGDQRGYRHCRSVGLGWVEIKEGTVLPPRGEKVLIYIAGEIRYQELKYGENEYGESTVGPSFTHFARVTPPDITERID